MGKTIAIDINDVIRDNISQFIKYYIKEEDNLCEITPEDVTSHKFDEIFEFGSHEDYITFKYIDFPFELYGRAELTEENLNHKINEWIQNALSDLDENEVPNIMLVSPFEYALTIQATYAFISRIGLRVREVYFPKDSATIWDKCDILITASPDLIENKPEGKTVVKINAPYNKDIEGDYNFDTLSSVINDENNTIINLLKTENND